jgi:serine/threonine protein phosphatase 1
MRGLLRSLFRAPSIPPHRIDPGISRIYAIGDVHGDIDALQRVERAILEDLDRDGYDPSRALTLLLGDMIDRGRFSAHVIDHLSRPVRSGPARLCLRGNHEQMLLDLLDGRGDAGAWLALGGEATLRSYAPDRSALTGAGRRVERMFELMPDRHIGFLRGLPMMATAEGLLFSHAGGDPDLPLHRQTRSTLLRRRPPAEEGGRRPAHGLLSLHGHQPVPEPTVTGWRVNLDTSAAQPPRLTCARICVAKKIIEKFLTG